ncbi:hypothetical protein [Kribbella sp. NPDC051620]|uniref:hypothetical protein n=1 Tax=Kribbella sp. NPDC051620 TaxID=3364120 RepID=UPI0037A04933
MALASRVLGSSGVRRQLRAQLEAAELRSKQEVTELRSQVEQAELRAQRAQAGPGWRLAAVGAALLALLGVGGTVAGAAIGAGSASKTTSQQQGEERDREAREKRGQVYADYLSATALYQAGLERLQQSKAQGDAAETEFRALVVLYQTFVNKADLVFIYGSDDAWEAHLMIRSAIPEVMGGPAGGISGPVGMENYNSAYNSFQAVFCREASARPRAGCGKTVQRGPGN